MDPLVLEQEFDRVLDREDVAGTLLVAVVEHGRQRRALARAGAPTTSIRPRFSA